MTEVATKSNCPTFNRPWLPMLPLQQNSTALECLKNSITDLKKHIQLHQTFERFLFTWPQHSCIIGFPVRPLAVLESSQACNVFE